jgi:hypothetical protein
MRDRGVDRDHQIERCDGGGGVGSFLCAALPGSSWDRARRRLD